MNWIANKHVMITGASSGIGKALAVALHRKCKKLTLIARNSHGHLDELRDYLKTQAEIGSQAFDGDSSVAETECIELDVRDLSGTYDTINKVYVAGGQIDCFVHCAGGSHVYAPFEEMSHPDIDTIINTNVKSTLHWLRELLPRMKNNSTLHKKRAHIILLSSRSGERTLPNLSAYTVAKGAVEKISDAMQREYARYGIAFTLINPGSINTNFTSKWEEKPRNDHNAESMSTEEVMSLLIPIMESEVVVNKISFESVDQWKNEPGTL